MQPAALHRDYGVAPTVTNVTSTTADGTYGVGDVINIEVVFSQQVVVTGTPNSSWIHRALAKPWATHRAAAPTPWCSATRLRRATTPTP